MKRALRGSGFVLAIMKFDPNLPVSGGEEGLSKVEVKVIDPNQNIASFSIFETQAYLHDMQLTSYEVEIKTEQQVSAYELMLYRDGRSITASGKQFYGYWLFLADKSATKDYYFAFVVKEVLSKTSSG